MLDFYEGKIEFELSILEEAFFKAIEELKKLPFVDSEHLLHTALKDGKKVLAEGAQCYFLQFVL